MSTPRYDWWPYVKGMTRRYPQLMQQYKDLHETRLTAQLDGMPGANRLSRPVEDAALRTLPRIHMKELTAVHGAVRRTLELPRGEERIKLIRMVYWDRSHTLAGAAMRLDIAEVTAKRWHGEFLREVGREFGLLDDA